MSRMCGTCKGTGLLTSLDQLQRSTAPKTVPCHTCRGRGFVEDVIDLAAENERLKAKAKHYVCVRERNRETIDDLKGKLNAAESENKRLKAKLDALTAISEQDDRCHAQLKAKLDAVRELANDIVWSTLGLPGYWANSIYIKSLKILGIIDGDGDDA